MKVVILGAGTAIPAIGYSPAGIYVRAGREHWLLDAGPGTAQRLQQIGISIFELDRIFLTHYHLDHCLDLASILFALRLPAPREANAIRSARQAGIPDPVRRKPLAVYGPSGLRRLYARLNAAFHGWLTPRRYRLTLHELRDQARHRLGGGVVMRCRRMRHSTPALGYRLETGRESVVYSGDTEACPAIMELARGSGTLILECSVPDERKVAGHLTPGECGRIAAQARCRHLVLTHLYPVFRGYDIRRRVRRHFRGRVTVARDLTVLGASS